MGTPNYNRWQRVANAILDVFARRNEWLSREDVCRAVIVGQRNTGPEFERPIVLRMIEAMVDQGSLAAAETPSAPLVSANVSNVRAILDVARGEWP